MLARSALRSARTASNARSSLGRTVTVLTLKPLIVMQGLICIPALRSVLVRRCRFRGCFLSFPIDRGRVCGYSYGGRVDGVVPPPLRAHSLCNDTCGRRVWIIANSVKGFKLKLVLRLHSPKYPWEHEKFTKTFDHQSYAPPMFAATLMTNAAQQSTTRFSSLSRSLLVLPFPQPHPVAHPGRQYTHSR